MTKIRNCGQQSATLVHFWFYFSAIFRFSACCILALPR